MERIGIDLGGTKIEGIVLSGSGDELARNRIDTPAGDYQATVEAIASLVESLEAGAGRASLPVGIGTPGSRSRQTGLMKNCNSTCLNGRPLKEDIESRLERAVAMANDANCLALSEWTDGAAAEAGTVFGIILGTGVGGGLLVDGRVVEGAGGVGGEWGHVPLPWPDDAERPGPPCYCGRNGCMEQWCSGPALAADHERSCGTRMSPKELVSAADGEDEAAMETMDRWLNRLARGLAIIANIIDPDVFVFGGGLSNTRGIYEKIPVLIEPWLFSDEVVSRFVPALHGDSSGVRGAARLEA